MARLAGGTIVAAGEAAWAPGPDGQPTRLGRGAAPAGAPVAIGPAGELTALVVPTAWVGRRGWPTLWARAHRTARSQA